MNIDLHEVRRIIIEWCDAHDLNVETFPIEPADGNEPSFMPIDLSWAKSDTASYSFNLHDDGMIRNSEYDEDTDEDEHYAFEAIVDELMHILQLRFGIVSRKAMFFDTLRDAYNPMNDELRNLTEGQ